MKYRIKSLYDNNKLTDIIANISPVDTPMLSRFGKTKAKNTLHEWQTDALDSASTTGVVEGSDVETSALTATSRLGNYTQISRRMFRVTETQEAIDHAGRASEYAYQAAKALKSLANDMEKTLHDGTGNSGASGTARELKGVRAAITTNVVTAATGSTTAALTVDKLNELLRTIWAQGGKPNAIYVNGTQKEAVAKFSTPITRNIDAASKRYTNVVNVFDSAYGTLDIILDRYATTSELLALQEDQFKVAFLRPVMTTELPNNGGGRKGKVEAEYTLQFGNEKASGKITNLA